MSGLRQRLEAHLGTVLFLTSFAIYLFTLAPSAMWGDSAKYVIHSATWQLSIDGGYHPTYAILSAAFVRLFPFGDAAVALNVLSALFGAASVVLLFRLIIAERVRPAIAGCASLAFAFSHAHWHLSVIAESYTLSVLGILATMIVVRPLLHSDATNASPTIGRFFAVGAVAGLVISNFLLMIAYFGLLLGLFALFAREPWRHQPLKKIAAVVGGTVAGTSLIWGPWLYYVQGGMLSADQATSLALNGRYASTFFWQAPAEAFRGLTLLSGLTLYQFPSPLLAFAIPGVWWMRERLGWTLWLVGMMVGTYLFCSTYMIQRAVFVLVPVFALWTLFAAVGLDRVIARLGDARPRRRQLCWASAVVMAIAPIPVYPAFLSGLAYAEIDPVPGRDVPYRQNAKYFLLPAKHHDDGPERLTEEILARVGAGCVIADFTPFTAISYQLSRRPHSVTLRSSEGVDAPGLETLIESYVDTGLGLYFVDDEAGAYPIEELAPDYQLEAAGKIWRVVAKPSPASPASSG